MEENQEPLVIAKGIAREIKNELMGSHLSTLTYDLPVKESYIAGKGKIPIFVVVTKFNSGVATKLSNIAQKWKDKRIEGPFIAEQADFKGMEDSVPEELWNVSKNYTVLEGMDLLKQLPKFDIEYLRAQAEQTIRGYIFKLRWTLPQALHDPSELKNYMNNMAFYCQLTIQLYHKLAHPEIRTIEGHLINFSKEFPGSWKFLKELMEHIYGSKPVDKDVVELLTNTIDSVFVVILDKIDKMGK